MQEYTLHSLGALGGITRDGRYNGRSQLSGRRSSIHTGRAKCSLYM